MEEKIKTTSSSVVEQLREDREEAHLRGRVAWKYGVHYTRMIST